ncbi:NfeD family protein [Patescibacteria group bacterium]|nr:NfeD family protein [Patescibacteria group bacterium]
MLLLSFFSHELDIHTDFHLDGDHDAAGADHSDTDGNSLGLIKSILIFVALGAWITRMLLLENINWIIALLAGGITGFIGIYVLGKFLGFLLKQQSEGNWKYENAVGQLGTVYLAIPDGGVGQIQITINGGLRTVDAIANEGTVATGKEVAVLGVDENSRLIVTPYLPNTDGTFELLSQGLRLSRKESELKIN